MRRLVNDEPSAEQKRKEIKSAQVRRRPRGLPQARSEVDNVEQKPDMECSGDSMKKPSKTKSWRKTRSHQRAAQGGSRQCQVSVYCRCTKEMTKSWKIIYWLATGVADFRQQEASGERPAQTSKISSRRDPNGGPLPIARLRVGANRNTDLREKISSLKPYSTDTYINYMCTLVNNWMFRTVKLRHCLMNPHGRMLNNRNMHAKIFITPAQCTLYLDKCSTRTLMLYTNSALYVRKLVLIIIYCPQKSDLVVRMCLVASNWNSMSEFITLLNNHTKKFVGHSDFDLQFKQDPYATSIHTTHRDSDQDASNNVPNFVL